MKRLKVCVNTIDRVRDFVVLNNMSDCEVDVRHLHYIVDGKSLLGVFSIPLTKPLDVEIRGDDVDVLIAQYVEAGLTVEE